MSYDRSHISLSLLLLSSFLLSLRTASMQDHTENVRIWYDYVCGSSLRNATSATPRFAIKIRRMCSCPNLCFDRFRSLHSSRERPRYAITPRPRPSVISMSLFRLCFSQLRSSTLIYLSLSSLDCATIRS